MMVRAPAILLGTRSETQQANVLFPEGDKKRQIVLEHD
jgi:hypothetical protein